MTPESETRKALFVGLVVFPLIIIWCIVYELYLQKHGL